MRAFGERVGPELAQHPVGHADAVRRVTQAAGYVRDVRRALIVDLFSTLIPGGQGRACSMTPRLTVVPDSAAVRAASAIADEIATVQAESTWQQEALDRAVDGPAELACPVSLLATHPDVEPVADPATATKPGL
jgi:hypothetical protein